MPAPWLAPLLSVGAALLPAILGGGNSPEEDAREDEYNANSGQHINNFLNDYVMQPIGPGPGMPGLNDPEAFEAYDPMNPMAYGNVPVNAPPPPAPLSFDMGQQQVGPMGMPNTPGDDEILGMLPPGAIEEMFLMAQEQGGGQGQEQYADPFTDPEGAGVASATIGMEPPPMPEEEPAGGPMGLDTLLQMFGSGMGPSLPLMLASKGKMGMGLLGATPLAAPLGDLFGGRR